MDSPLRVQDPESSGRRAHGGHDDTVEEGKAVTSLERTDKPTGLQRTASGVQAECVSKDEQRQSKNELEKHSIMASKTIKSLKIKIHNDRFAI